MILYRTDTFHTEYIGYTTANHYHACALCHLSKQEKPEIDEYIFKIKSSSHAIAHFSSK